MHHLFPESKPYPPYVIGAVTDWDTWLDLSDPAGMPPCNAVELRVDALPASIDCDTILNHWIWKPVLVTIRRQEEGAFRPIPDAERMNAACRLMSRASGLDWEIACMPQATELLKEAKNASVTIVASAHFFDRMPELDTFRRLEEQARNQGADVVKFAFRLRTLDEMLRGTEILSHATGPTAIMGMGPLGPTSRLLYAQLGSVLVYGYLGDNESAPGQWPAHLFQNALLNLEAFRTPE